MSARLPAMEFSMKYLLDHPFLVLASGSGKKNNYSFTANALRTVSLSTHLKIASCCKVTVSSPGCKKIFYGHRIFEINIRSTNFFRRVTNIAVIVAMSETQSAAKRNRRVSGYKKQHHLCLTVFCHKEASQFTHVCNYFVQREIVPSEHFPKVWT